MSASAEYTEYVLEMLEPVGPVTTGRFFGGVGLSHDAVQFAMIMENSLYFVVDDTTRPKYEEAGMKPFSYVTKKGRIQVRRYFELPEEVLTDPAILKTWARESIYVAGQTKKPGKPARIKSSRTSRRESPGR
jgi:DNA transformation protein